MHGCAIEQKDVLTIRLDARGTGEFKDCVTSYKIPIQSEWYKRLYLGVTASTGQLADNHDIISIITSAGDSIAPEKQSLATPELSTGNPQIDAAIKVRIGVGWWLRVCSTASRVHHASAHDPPHRRRWRRRTRWWRRSCSTCTTT